MLDSYFRYLYKDVSNRSKNYLMDLLSEKSESLLDLGCWDGKNTVLYAKQCGASDILGVEIEKSKAKEAEDKGIKVALGDLNTPLKLPDESAGCIVANHVIEHLTQTEQFISEVHRVLKKGGYAVIATPNLASWHNIFALLLGMQPFSGPHVRISDHDISAASKMDKEKAKDVLQSTSDGDDFLRHLVILTYRELVKNFERAGFTVEKSKGFGYYPLPGFLGALFSSIDKRHSHYVVIKVRKK